MAKFHPSVQLRRTLSERATGLCEYCKCPEAFSPQSFSVEHIVAKSRGGNDDLDNLAFSCQGCNAAKSSKTTSFDPATAQPTPLFHPRLDKWSDHFRWDENSHFIIGMTPVGRATVALLQMNRPFVVNLRKLLILGGEHQPE